MYKRNSPSFSLVLLTATVLVIAACANAPVQTTPEMAAPPAATQAPAATPTQPTKPASSGSNKYGGILRHAIQPPSNLDPAFLSTVPDDEIGRQWHDFLVFIGEDNQPDQNRSLAEGWDTSLDGLTWTFKLRRGILFFNGKEMTARDVKFTFDRLRDPKISAATVDLYNNIASIEAPDDYIVAFKLKRPNPDFLKDLGDYHALIMDADGKNFSTEWNGTGPFMIESYDPDKRIVFKRNPNYWLKDRHGNQLPYLDGMEFIFISDSKAQVDALRAGEVDWVIYLPAEYAFEVEADPNTVVYRQPSNTSYVLRMRSDRPPAQDNRVRQALKLATDREVILQQVFQGLGVAGRDTPFGPVYGDFYLDEPLPPRNVEKARELLAEAGYADGLTIDIYCQDRAPVPGICNLWKEQMAEAGVTVNVNLVSVGEYYGAENMWLEVDFAITDWGSRPYPQPYLDLAYVCNAQWNESHWCDEELDQLAAQAAQEMGNAKRTELYHRIQRILRERGPIIQIFFVDNLFGASVKLNGIIPPMGMGTSVDLRYAYLSK